MSFDPAKSEWRGVVQIYDKVKNGLYRANATAIIMFFFLLIMYFVAGGHQSAPNATWLDGLSALFGLPALMWIIAFGLGYSGTAFVGGGIGVPIENVTPDTNMSIRDRDIALFQPVGEGTIVNDMYTGRLSAQSDGLDGIIKFSWKDILSITSVNSQNVSIKRTDRLFSIPVGKRSFTLHFDTPEDASAFLQVVGRYKKV
jgi:hypothetical protein